MQLIRLLIYFQYCDSEGQPKLEDLSIPVLFHFISVIKQTIRLDSDIENDRVAVFFIRGTDKKVTVYYCIHNQINAATFESKLTTMQGEGMKRVILVFGGDLTSDAKKVCIMVVNYGQKLNGFSSSMIVEHFSEDELVVDITEHELVPEHQLLKPQEKAYLLKQYGLEERQLPQIQKRDPIARYFGAQKGQVFRIVRKSETAGKYVTYRIVDS